jgi:hypothetical protein
VARVPCGRSGHAERTQAETELKTLERTAPAAADPALLDEIPYAGDIIPTLPPALKARLLATFDIAILWNKPGNQATVRAVITDTTLDALPAILNPGQDGYDNSADPDTAPAAVGPLTQHTRRGPIAQSAPGRADLAPGCSHVPALAGPSPRVNRVPSGARVHLCTVRSSGDRALRSGRHGWPRCEICQSWIVPSMVSRRVGRRVFGDMPDVAITTEIRNKSSRPGQRGAWVNAFT